eukprot:TCALIF_08223-PA protein Name:"Similar to Csmd3 CUB and sushi domain-containing protein 3 (Mus musculus)" AED:0.21 eAED:0.21 QI:126/0.6/0.54/0.90/0.8/0.72/11/0/672
MGSMAIQVLTVLLWIWGSTHLGSCAIPGANLAFEQTALQSSTSWSYRADLAVDGDKDTCSLTPRASEQRWWQVILPEDTQIQSVAVSVMAESEQEFTIFVIEQIPCVPISIKNGQASYSKDEVTQQDMIDFVCDEGFVLWGSSQGKCLRNGIWEFNMKPSCNPMTCGEPPNLPNTHVVLQRENRNKTVAAELGDEAIYSCSGQLQMVKNGTYNAYIIEIKAVCSMDGTWRMDSFFSCLNQSEIVSDLVILESDHFVFWEWLLYFLMVLLIVVLLLVLFCALWRANQKRNSEKENTVVTRPRNMNNPYGTSTNYLLPSLNGKPGILKNESQFNENFEEDQNNQRGPSIDTTSSSLPEMRFNDDEPLEQPQNNSRQLPMSTFKPHQLYSGATNVSPTPNLYWSPDMHHNQYPNMSNWDLRVKAFPLEAHNPLLGYPDLLKNTEENPYVNDEVIAANSAEMYAKIDLSKKRNSRREEDEDKEVDETLGQNHGEGAERVRPAQDRASQTPQPRVLEQDLINKFDRFFNTDQCVRSSDEKCSEQMLENCEGWYGLVNGMASTQCCSNSGSFNGKPNIEGCMVCDSEASPVDDSRGSWTEGEAEREEEEEEEHREEGEEEEEEEEEEEDRDSVGETLPSISALTLIRLRTLELEGREPVDEEEGPDGAWDSSLVWRLT